MGLLGVDGAPGRDGAAGADGIHCWDLDSNGQCDSDVDDTMYVRVFHDRACVFGCEADLAPEGREFPAGERDAFQRELQVATANPCERRADGDAVLVDALVADRPFLRALDQLYRVAEPGGKDGVSWIAECVGQEPE
jgi:hypothetical protein